MLTFFRRHFSGHLSDEIGFCRAPEYCVQASETALANAAHLVRDAQARLTDAEANVRASRAEAARLQGAIEAARDAYRTTVAGATAERQRLVDGHATEVCVFFFAGHMFTQTTIYWALTSCCHACCIKIGRHHPGHPRR